MCLVDKLDTKTKTASAGDAPPGRVLATLLQPKVMALLNKTCCIIFHDCFYYVDFHLFFPLNCLSKKNRLSNYPSLMFFFSFFL